ncbi:MAG: hypothetical protein KatS3mg091_161 [Patescibacteria group bacterium]|nr:MAG: hypothetical protein KatS3mg091_161 [Patescibacteria group bacterium]
MQNSKLEKNFVKRFFLIINPTTSRQGMFNGCKREDKKVEKPPQSVIFSVKACLYE